MGTPVTQALAVGRVGRRRFSWPWLRPIFEWFFCYPPLFLEAAGLLLIVLAVEWDPLGARQIGLPSLFWHHSIWVQFTAGFGIAAVLGEICLVGYLLDAERKWMTRGVPIDGEEGPAARTSWWYFFVTLTYPLLVFAAALPAVFDLGARWALPLGLMAGALVVLALTRFGRSLSPEQTGLFDWLLNLPKLRQRLPEEWRDELSSRGFVFRLPQDERAELRTYYHLHAFHAFVSLALAATYAALYLAAVYWSAEFVSPALVICVLLALLTTVYGFVVFHFPLRHFGVVFLLVAGYFCVSSYVSQQYRFDGLNYDRPTLLTELDDGPKPKSGLLDNDFVLEAWREHRRQFLKDRKPVLVVVATKAGGARSAAWTTAVLTQLEKELPELPYHTRLISGVSGGMLGAAYYVATLNEPGSASLHTVPGEKGSSNDAEEIVNRISRDSLSPVVRHLALPIRGDRGAALEKAWEKNTAGALALPFTELRKREESGWCPSLVFSPMLVEDGRRLIISNLDLDFLVHNRGSLLRGHQTPGDKPQAAEYSQSGWQFFELFPDATTVRLSTLVRMNASFPYISPDAELATSPPRRVVDAAYYDGYGVNLAAMWIHYNREFLREQTAGVVLIQIRDRPRNFQPPSSMSGWRRAVARFTTPIEGAIRARDATMSFRNDEILHVVGEELSQPAHPGQAEDPDFFTTAIFEYPEKAPLSWYLPPEDLRAMKKEVADPEGRFAQEAKMLKAWWQRRMSQSD